MGIVDLLQPRDRAEARRSVLVLTVVGTLVTVILAVTAPESAGGTKTALTCVVPIAVALAVAACALTRSRGAWLLGWAVFPFVAIGTLCGLDIATHDSSITAFLFLFFPVLYAGFQVPRRGAALVLAADLGAVLAVALTLMPPDQAFTTTVTLSAFLLTSGGLLVYTSERRAALVHQLRLQAAVDPLTGLATRRILDQTAQSVLLTAHREGGTALLLVDIDHFKAVNDEYGHIAGDDVLVHIARALTETASSDALVSRMGGDELALLLPGCTLAAASALADQICTTVRSRPVPLTAELSVQVTVSIGAAHAPTQANDLRSLYATADAALYRAKRAGRDRAATLDGLAGEHEATRHGGQRRAATSVGTSVA